MRCLRWFSGRNAASFMRAACRWLLPQARRVPARDHHHAKLDNQTIELRLFALVALAMLAQAIVTSAAFIAMRKAAAP